MASQPPVDPVRDRSERDPDVFQADSCVQLEDEVEDLQEQIAVLEEGLPAAPGAQRAALAKEIATYRQELESREAALRRCRVASDPSSR